MTKFSIITPTFNAANLIAETAESILSQHALKSQRATLEYILIDGESTDNTVTILEQTAAQFATQDIKIISRKDQSMYEALAHGFQIGIGDVCAYLNAGDLYSPYAFDIVMDVMEQTGARWLTGMDVVHNEKGHLVYANVPFRYRRSYFEHGLYNGIYWRQSPYLQQESTFWKRSLLGGFDYDAFAHCRLAGDYLLWIHLAAQTELTIVEAHLGGFRVHENQLSEKIDAYHHEARQFVKSPLLHQLITVFVERYLWSAQTKIKKLFNPHGLLIYDHNTHQWK